MNSRERFLETALFGKPDKVPLGVGDIRPATRKQWIKEGLAENVSLLEYLGFKESDVSSGSITSYPSEGFKWEPSPSAVNLGPIPSLECRIIKEDERYRIWVDSLGVTSL